MFGMSISSVSSIVTKKKPAKNMSYALSQMAPLSDISGNVSVYMDNTTTRVYMAVSTGNVYIGDVVNNTWTQSVLASGSAGSFINRDFFSIVCDGTGQYVITCVRSDASANGTVFYSSDYGSTFTVSDSSINKYCFNLAMSSDGNNSYLSTWGEAAPLINTVATGKAALYKSLDRGITWTPIVLAANGYTYTSLPCQVKCNNTGEYISMSFWKQIQNCVMLSDYGNTIIFAGPVANNGYINSNPGVFTNAGNTAVRALCINRTTSTNYSFINKVAVYTNSPYTSGFGISSNSPYLFVQVSGANTSYPWTGARIIASTSDFTTIFCTDTGNPSVPTSIGNVYICTNGMPGLAWFSTASVDGISSWSNFSVSQNIPRAAWSGLCVNYNNNFAFANSVGNVYIYAKPLA